MKPLLTIFVPSYNYGHYLPQALDSILSQDFSDYELIIIDDGSTDDSVQVAKSYAEKDARIHLIAHQTNGGLFKRLKEALEMAQGLYFHAFSADDIYLPGFLSKSIQALQKYPEVGLCCADFSYFKDDSSASELKKLLPSATEIEKFSPEKALSLFKTTQFWIPGTTCIVKRDLFIQYGGLDPQLENLSDWFLCHHLALFEGVIYIPEMLTSMRLHPQTYTNQVKKNKKRKRRVYRHLLNKLSFKENKEISRRFIEANLLKFISRELSWQLLLKPRYWKYYKLRS